MSKVAVDLIEDFDKLSHRPKNTRRISSRGNVINLNGGEVVSEAERGTTREFQGIVLGLLLERRMAGR